MSKKKATILLSILSVIIATVLVFTFIQFPVGAAGSYVGAIGGVTLDYDLEDGVAYTLTLSEDNDEEVEDVNQVVNEIKERIEFLGYGAYSVKVLEDKDPLVLDDEIRVELKSKAGQTDSDIAAILAYGDLHFYGEEQSDPIKEILKDVKVIADSQYLGLYEEGNHGISIVLTNEAKDELVKAIESASGSYYLKIACGVEGHEGHSHEKVLFNGEITKDAINGNTIGISGISSREEAQRFILQLKHGGIDYNYEYESESISSIYANQADDNVAQKVLVAIITIVVVFAICNIVLFKGLGIIVALSNLVFIIGETWLMIGVPGIILSIGGIIGIIASTIVCATASLFFAQRVKDEYASSKKTVKAAISKGFRQGLIPTINLHVVSGVVALALLFLANATLKNFAITFGIGLAVSLITNLVITRMYTALILPLVKDKEKFLRFERAEAVAEASEEVTEEA